MSNTIKLSKGYDINILGAPKKVTETALVSHSFSIKPIDFQGVSPIPKLAVEVGDKVKAGDTLFFDKKAPTIMHCSPVSGEVAEIRRGAKRAIHEVVIKADETVEFKNIQAPDLSETRRDALVEFLLSSGVWPFIIQRPFGTIANPLEVPRDIFVSGFDTAPLAADFNYLIVDKFQALQKGFDVLASLTDGQVHLGLSGKGNVANELEDLKNVQRHYFKGAHPAGNVGVQIHHTSPINKGEVVWTVHLQNVIAIGRLFLDGQFNTERMIALGGPQVKEPKYFRTYLGANVAGMLKENLESEHVRVISGNPLTGCDVGVDGHIGAFDSQVSVIEEGDDYEFMGWLMPSSARPSISRTFLSTFLNGSKKFDVTTNTHGEHRAFVMTGQYEQVLPMDIYPVQLLKSILYEDLDQMEGLGIYEVIEEDLALCEFVCTSKTEVQQILRRGLDIMREQG